MVEFSERTQANMDVVLEEVCAELPNGGDHCSAHILMAQHPVPATPQAALQLNSRSPRMELHSESDGT